MKCRARNIKLGKSRRKNDNYNCDDEMYWLLQVATQIRKRMNAACSTTGSKAKIWRWFWPQIILLLCAGC